MNPVRLKSKEEAQKYIDSDVRVQVVARFAQEKDKGDGLGFSQESIDAISHGAVQIQEEIEVNGHKVWSYLLDSPAMALSGQIWWLLDTGETVETGLLANEETIKKSYEAKYIKPFGHTITDFNDVDESYLETHKAEIEAFIEKLAPSDVLSSTSYFDNPQNIRQLITQAIQAFDEEGVIPTIAASALLGRVTLKRPEAVVTELFAVINRLADSSPDVLARAIEELPYLNRNTDLVRSVRSGDVQAALDWTGETIVGKQYAMLVMQGLLPLAAYITLASEDTDKAPKVGTIDDEEIIRKAYAMIDELERTNGFTTDESSGQKQAGPVGEIVKPGE